MRRKKKKRKQLNESRISLREEFSFEGAIIRILASIEPIQHTKTVRYTFSSSFSFLPFPPLRRTDDPRQLPPSRVVDREREDGNEISTLWNSMGWFMTAISHQWRHPAHRLVETLPDPLSLSFPPFHSRTCSFLLLSVLFYGNGERVGIINGEEINWWRAIRRRFVWSATAVHHALTAWIEARVSIMRDLGFFFFFLIVEW